MAHYRSSFSSPSSAANASSHRSVNQRDKQRVTTDGLGPD